MPAARFMSVKLRCPCPSGKAGLVISILTVHGPGSIRRYRRIHENRENVSPDAPLRGPRRVSRRVSRRVARRLFRWPERATNSGKRSVRRISGSETRENVMSGESEAPEASLTVPR